MYGINLPGEFTPNLTTRIDIKKQMMLGGQHLIHVLNPEAFFLPYWALNAGNYLQPSRNYSTYTAEFSSGGEQHNTGRWWDAILRLEHAVGFKIPPEIERRMLANLKIFFDNADNLNAPPADRTVFPSDVLPHLDLHSQREGLLALNALIKYRNNAWAIDQSQRTIASLFRLINEDGMWNYDKIEYLKNLDDSPETKPQNAGPETTGRMLEAIVRVSRETGFTVAARLAKRIAEIYLHTTKPGRDHIIGTADKPVKRTHSHSLLGTIRGLLLYGELTGDREYIETVEAMYRNWIREFITPSGYICHDWGVELYGDVAACGDAAQIALWLAERNGYTEYFDDVSRYVRARIMPSQITQTPELKPLGDPDTDKYKNLGKRIIGAFGGINKFPHAGKFSVTDVHAAVVHTLSDVYQHIVVKEANGLRINFHFNYEDEYVSIRSGRSAHAIVTIKPKIKKDIFIRIPRWVPKESIKVSADDVRAKVVMKGDYAHIRKDFMPAEIQLSYALPTRTETERIDFVDYELLWRGDEVLGAYPNSDFFPFYPTYISAQRAAHMQFKENHNVASIRRGTAITASSYNAEESGEPENAIDGNTSNRWSSLAKPTVKNPQWLLLDFGKVRTIRSVVVDDVFDELQPVWFKIQVSTTGKDFDTIAEIRNNAAKLGKWKQITEKSKADTQRLFHINFDVDITARYVRYLVMKESDLNVASSKKFTGTAATLRSLEVYDKLLPDLMEPSAQRYK